MSFDINKLLERRPALIIRTRHGIERVEFLKHYNVQHCYVMERMAREKRGAA